MNRLADGVLAGASAGSVYGAISTLLTLMRPLLLGTPARDLQKLPAVATLLVIWTAFIAIGAVTGLACAAFDRSKSLLVVRRTTTAAAVFMLLLWSLWLLVRTGDPRPDPGIVLSCFAGLFLLVIVPRIPAPRTVFLPFFAGLMIMGPLWLDHALIEHSRDLRWTILVVALAALGVSWSFIAIRFEYREPRRVLLALSIVLQISVVAGAVWWISRPSFPRDALDRPRAASTAPNVILIVLDTVRAANMSLYGYEAQTTPFLEELAGEMTVYHGLAASDMTLSTHASMFTGVSPTRHGAHVNDEFVKTSWAGIPEQPGQALSHDRKTLAEMLRTRGYVTASIAANCAYLGKLFGLARGFDYVDPREPAQIGTIAPEFMPRSAVFRLLEKLGLVRGPHNIYRIAEEINRDADPILEELASAERPFFLFLNYMDAHAPYKPPAPFDRLYPGKIEGFGMAEQWALDTRVMTGGPPVTARERAHLVSQYDGGLAYLDDQLRHLIERLKELGIYDDTLLIITSDHGEGFGSRGYLEHAWSVHGELIEIPFMIKTPGQTRGRRSPRHATTTDIFATILDAVPARLPGDTEGISLLRSDPPAGRIMIAESFPSAWYLTNPALRRTQRAVQRDTFKLITSSRGEILLYDKSADPNERRNLSSHEQYQGVRQRLTATLEEWLTAAAPAPGENVAPDAESIRILRSLGYIR